VIGASVTPVGRTADPDDQRLHARTIVRLTDDLTSRFARERCLVIGSSPQRDMVDDHVGE
jgi:hypothetical protein